jgi:hypothetical protein
MFSIKINIKKTVVLSQWLVRSENNISIKNVRLESVKSFNYLESKIASAYLLDEEINTQTGKAATTFGKLTARTC